MSDTTRGDKHPNTRHLYTFFRFVKKSRHIFQQCAVGRQHAVDVDTLSNPTPFEKTMTRREPLFQRLANFLRIPARKSITGPEVDRKASSVPRRFSINATFPEACDQQAVIEQLNRISPIYDRLLYLSGAPPINGENLKKLGVTLVVCALTTYEEQVLGFKYPEGIAVTYIRAGDLETVPLHLWFETAANVIHNEVTRGGVVLVHCAAGVSRSPSLILAYMIKYNSLSLPEAFLMIRKKRPIVRPNRGFVQQLIEFEKRCRDKNGGGSALSMFLPCTKRKFSL